MRLSWNEIRARAAAFAEKWRDAAYEKGETQSFYNDFFEIFRVKRRTVARYEEHVKRLDGSHGYIDLFWPGVLLVEQKSAGRSLDAAREQAGTYFDALPERDRPRYQLLCDFQTFALLDRDERRETRFALADLPRHVEAFGFILGVQRRAFRDQDPVNVRASERMGRLHDALEASGYTGHDLERFLVRTVFCLFADNTGIFEPRDSFLDLLETRTREDGSDLGLWLARLFQVLDTPEDRRQKALDEDLVRFPYVNGALFRGPLRIPDFDAPMREALLDACRFDWTAISPAIFGALFQSVMEPADRRAQGAHYTTEQNILKVIEPLFLDDLRAEFARLRARKDTHRRAALQRFQQKLGALRFLDPACGCGNFLIIAYRELRALEIDVIRELRASAADPDTAEYLATDLSVVNVDQFSGIEVGEFPARIAETALWMMDHIMNTRLSLEFGQSYVRIPLRTAPRIVHGDALELDWATVLPPEDCAYVFGNPPFVGAKYQTPAQRAQVHRVAALGKSGGTLDYVAAWFVTAGRYVQRGAARIGFVATNSITQGEQVSQLWPVLFARCGLEIVFAHRTFAWGSDARGKAHVHVVILGLAKRAASPESGTGGRPGLSHSPRSLSSSKGEGESAAPRAAGGGSSGAGAQQADMAGASGGPPSLTLPLRRAQGPGGGKTGRRAVRRLFSYDDLKGEPHESRHAALSPYLFDVGGLADPHVVVRETARPINGLPKLVIGSKPIDGGHYIFDASEREAFLREEPGAEPLLRPFVGSREFLQGGRRWILHLADVPPDVLRTLPKVQERIAAVRANRQASKSRPTQALAETPTLYHVNVIPDAPFLIVPKVSSERRAYTPIAWMEPPVIPSDLVFVLRDASKPLFGLLTSAMHMAWLRHIGGRLESRYRYSIGLVYNTFPPPPVHAARLVKLEPLAQAILDARTAHPNATLADLYDPDVMPPNLRKAHAALDRAVDRLYRPQGFTTERERVEHLLSRYEKLATPLTAKDKPKRRRRAPSRPRPSRRSD